jgi:hypothetical protein
MLREGSTAPDFALHTADGQPVSLSETLRGGHKEIRLNWAGTFCINSKSKRLEMSDSNEEGERTMNRYLHLLLITWVGWLFPTACQSTGPAPAEPTNTPTNTPSPTPPAGETGNADVFYVKATQTADGTWTFHVTVHHPDTGWDDYADGWDVLTPEGTVLKPDPDSPFTRLLLHPHVDEQPFTRSQSGIVIPPGVAQVRVRAHDLVDGYGGHEVLVDLTVPSGPDFEVIRPTPAP